MGKMDPPAQPSGTELNREYYSDLLPGKDHYWRKMAAPRFRVRTLLALLAELEDLQGLQGKPQSLIDLGCGSGQLLADIARRFPQLKLAGADLSEPQLDVNRRAMPGCQFYAMDLGRPDAVPDSLVGRFAVVTASEVIEHVDHPGVLLANAHRLCAPGGRLLLSTQSGRVGETERRVGHLRHFTAAEMSALLNECGWRPLRVWNSGYPFHDLSKWYANRNPDALLKEFADKPYGLKEDLICLLLRLAFRLNSTQRGAQLFAVAQRD